jgi:dTDP-glucose 4,6-dehydratase
VPNPLAADLDHVLAHTEKLWEDLRGQRLFITGGTGFVGRWLLESFLWANDRMQLGAEAVVLSRNPEKLARTSPHLLGERALSFWSGDMSDFAFPPGDFSHVIHAATEDHAGHREAVTVLERNLQGTRRALELARQRGARRFLFTSSGAVYGRQPDDVTHLSEDAVCSPDPMNTRAGYGHGKRVSEWLAAVYADEYGLEVTIGRLFAFAGPYLPLDANYAVGNFVRDALHGGPIRVRGDGTPYRSYLYAADLAVWLWTLLFRGPSKRPYNVGSDAALTIAELAQLVASVIAPQAPVVIAQRPNAGAEVERYVPSIDRARSELGLQCRVDLRSALLCMAAWHQMHHHEPASA